MLTAAAVVKPAVSKSLSSSSPGSGVVKKPRMLSSSVAAVKKEKEKASSPAAAAAPVSVSQSLITSSYSNSIEISNQIKCAFLQHMSNSLE